ncbi:MAG: hypothetical protein WAS27_03990 [Candidatus Saccharimonadales bacterium]
MATEKEVQDSIAAVRSGRASKQDHDRVEARSHVAGALGNQAKAAQRAGAKQTRASRSWF